MEDSRLKKVLRASALWVPSILLGFLFINQGIMKLQPDSPWVGKFDEWGYPNEFLLVTGAMELLGGIMLFVPRVARFGSVLLGVVMVGACLTHVVNGETTGTIVTSVIFAILVTLARVRWPRQHLPVATEPSPHGAE